MRKFIITTATFLLMVSAAHAKCGTKQLNGNWYLHQFGGEVFPVSIQDGAMTLLEPPGTAFPIAQSESCRVTTTIFGIELSGTTEAVPKGVTRRPRSIYVSSSAPTPSYYTIVRH
jgi:hypothetical protein